MRGRRTCDAAKTAGSSHTCRLADPAPRMGLFHARIFPTRIPERAAGTTAPQPSAVWANFNWLKHQRLSLLISTLCAQTVASACNYDVDRAQPDNKVGDPKDNTEPQRIVSLIPDQNNV